MAEFSVSYAGLEDAYSRLYTTYSKIAGISSDIYQTSRKVSGAKSLANKGYLDKIVACARNANTTAEKIRAQNGNLMEIGRLYSSTEKKVLSGLADKVTADAGFSGESVSIAGNALANHQSVNFMTLGQAFKESVLDPVHETLFVMDEFRYWRSSTARKWIEEHSLDVPLRDEFLDVMEGHFNRFETIAHGMLNPTNPNALKEAGETLGEIFGVSQVIKLGKRYYDIQGAVESRAQRELEQGHYGKYLAQMAAGSTLTFVQLAGDSVATGVKIVLDDVTGGQFSKWVAPVDKVFSGIGNGLRKWVDRI